MAYRGIDLRDLWRRGSGLTPRRLLNLIRYLPYDDPVMALLRLDEERSQKATPDEIRDRAAVWKARREAALAKEAASDG